MIYTLERSSVSKQREYLYCIKCIVDGPRKDLFKKEFSSTLQDLVKNTTSFIIQNESVHATLSVSIALFLKDLLSVMDRGFVFQLIGSFITRLDPRNAIKNLTSSKFKALKILCSYEHFIPLNIPIIKELESVTTVMSDFCDRHYLVGLLLDEVSACLSCGDPATRTKAITALRDVLWKQSQSPLVVGQPQKLEILSSMFFPFLIIVSSKFYTVVYVLYFLFVFCRH